MSARGLIRIIFTWNIKLKLAFKLIFHLKLSIMKHKSYELDLPYVINSLLKTAQERVSKSLRCSEWRGECMRLFCWTASQISVLWFFYLSVKIRCSMKNCQDFEGEKKIFSALKLLLFKKCLELFNLVLCRSRKFWSKVCTYTVPVKSMDSLFFVAVEIGPEG